MPRHAWGRLETNRSGKGTRYLFLFLIIVMRNRLVHGYFEVDIDQAWSTLTEDLPPLIEAIESVLEREFGG
jgi:uncharacterized protein YutE (UPF0331/DUF86 family)